MKPRLIILKKRLLTFVALATMLSMSMHGQDDDMMRHFSLSAGLGTTGLTADVGTSLGRNISLRGGIDFMPKIKYSTNLMLTLVNQTQEVDMSKVPEKKVEVTGTLHNTTGHALLDIYPSDVHDFHLTIGAYFAKNKIIDVTTEDSELLKQVADLNARRGDFANIPMSYGQVAAKLGDYNIMPDDDGHANAYMQVRPIRPYLGVGFGRVVPSESGMQCSFVVDLGVQFLGKPHVYNGVNGAELTAEGVRGEDGGLLKAATRFNFYPVLSFRFVGQIF